MNRLFYLISTTHALTILPPGDSSTWDLPDILVLIDNLIKIALTFGGGIAVILILIGAFFYLTAFGSEEKASKGKTIILWAVIGIVIILLSKIIVSAMLSAIQK